MRAAPQSKRHKTRKGWLSNYCGPGGSGSTQHETDKACKEHDEEYSVLEELGDDPYWKHNYADDQLIDRLRNIRKKGIPTMKEHLINAMADDYFTYKKKIATTSKYTKDQAHKENKKRKRDMVYKDDNGFFHSGAPPKKADDEDVQMKDEPPTREAPPKSEPGTDPEPSLAATGTRSTAFGSHETRVDRIPPTYGLQNTHTTIMPFDMWFSLEGTSIKTGTEFIFSLVNPISPITTTVTHLATAGSQALTPCCDRMIASPSNVGYRANEALFPAQMYDSYPYWWPFWTQLYDSYTVIGCHWQLAINNVGIKSKDDIMAAWAVEAYTATDTTNKMPSPADYQCVLTWEGMNWRVLEGTSMDELDNGTITIGETTSPHYDRVAVDFSSPEVISGSYKPYLKKHLVENDQDTETWHKVNNSPALKEDLHLYLFSSPLGTGDRVRCNCQLSIKYIVQFKDLKNGIRYMQDNTTPIELDIPAEVHQGHY